MLENRFQATHPKNGLSWLRKDATKDRPMAITYREYDLVRRDLRLPPGYFLPGEKVLSVGEGLSGFATILHQKDRVNVFSIDPIFSLGRKVLTNNITETTRIIADRFDNKVAVIDYREDRRAKIIAPEIGRITAASVYQLPFPNGYFSRILGNRVIEHIDITLALPEMIRVFRGGGEIRMGGLVTQVSPEQRKLFLGNNYYDGSGGEFYFVEFTGLQKALAYLERLGSWSAYIVADGLPKRSEVRDRKKLYQASVLIFRNDKQTPLSTEFSAEEWKSYSHLGKIQANYPFLGSVYKIEWGTFQSGSYPWESYYQLSPVR